MPKGTASGFGCGEDGNKVRDFPTRDGKNVAPNVPKDNVVNKGISMQSKLQEQRLVRVMKMMVISCISLFSVMSSF